MWGKKEKTKIFKLDKMIDEQGEFILVCDYRMHPGLPSRRTAPNCIAKDCKHIRKYRQFDPYPAQCETLNVKQRYNEC